MYHILFLSFFLVDKYCTSGIILNYVAARFVLSTRNNSIGSSSVLGVDNLLELNMAVLVVDMTLAENSSLPSDMSLKWDVDEG